MSNFPPREIYFADDPGNDYGIAFMLDDFCDVFHGIYDAKLTLNGGLVGFVDLPVGANEIRLTYDSKKGNWAWGGKDRTDFFMYTAYRSNEGETVKYLYLFDFRDYRIYRYRMSRNVWEMEWDERRNAFIVTTGSLNFKTRELDDRTEHLVEVAADPQKRGGLYPDISIVDMPEPPVLGASSHTSRSKVTFHADDTPERPKMLEILGFSHLKHPKLSFIVSFVGGLMVIGMAILSLFLAIKKVIALF